MIIAPFQTARKRGQNIALGGHAVFVPAVGVNL
jgi:hypothetical protein